MQGITRVDDGDDVGENLEGGEENSARVLRALEEMIARHFPIENSREPAEGSKEAAAFAVLLRGLLGAFVRCARSCKDNSFRTPHSFLRANSLELVRIIVCSSEVKDFLRSGVDKDFCACGGCRRV